MWTLLLGALAFGLFLSLVSDHMPRYLAWIIAGLFAYGLIFWT
jgi:uncharacterized protein (DUF2249 family)